MNKYKEFKDKYAEYREEIDNHYGFILTEKAKELSKELTDIIIKYDLKGKYTIKIMTDYDN